MYRILTALLLTLTMAAPVHADRTSRLLGYAEGLIFASETTLSGDVGARALCTVVEDLNVLFIPVQREVHGYALADHTCEGEMAAGVTPEAMQRLVDAGMIVEDVPTNPTLTIGWMLWNYAGPIVLILAALFIALSVARRKPVPEIEVPTITPKTPLFDETLLTTMFHTARLDGAIDQVTLQGLIKSFKTLTETTVTPAMINAQYATRTDTNDLLSIMHQFAGIERDTMMKGCLDVASANGIVQKTEHDFLMALGAALGLDGDMFRIQIQEAMLPERQRSQILNFLPA